MSQFKYAIGIFALLVALLAVFFPAGLLSMGLFRSMPTSAGYEQPRVSLDSPAPPLASFGLKFLNELSNATSGKNTFISPVSLWYCLGMATYGSSGSTLEEALSVLQMPSKDALGREMARLNGAFNEDARIEMANLIFHREGFKLNKNFKQKITDELGAAVEPVEKIDAEQVNSWVANKTHGLITDLVDDQNFSNVVASFLNAVHFKSNWASPFLPSDTLKDQPFRNEAEVMHVQMMETTEFFAFYNAAPEYSALEMPYVQVMNSSANLSAVIVLPREGYTVNQALASLATGSRYVDMIRSLAKKIKKSRFEAGEADALDYVNLLIPKFHLELKYSKEIENALISLGMKDIFDSSRANFSALTDNDANGFFVSDVTHQTSLTVGEYGTVAAAATKLDISFLSLNSWDVSFIVDRPFLFTIVNMDTQDLLFSGVISAPKL